MLFLLLTLFVWGRSLCWRADEVQVWIAGDRQLRLISHQGICSVVVYRVFKFHLGGDNTRAPARRSKR